MTKKTTASRDWVSIVLLTMAIVASALGVHPEPPLPVQEEVSR